MKTCLRLLLVFIILFPSLSKTTFAVSEQDEDIANACVSALKDEKTIENVEEFRDKFASILEEYILDLFDMALNAVDLNTLEQLLFGNPYCVWFEDEIDSSSLTYSIFPTSIKEEIIDPVFNLFTGTVVLFFCLSIMISGLKLGYSNIGGPRVDMGEELLMYFMTTLLLIGYWVGVDYIFMLNDAIVTSIGDMLKAQGLKMNGFSIVASQDGFKFTDIIVLFAEWVIMLFLNMVYLLRLLLITVLLMLGSAAIIGLLFEKTRKFFNIWFMTFIGTVFMQSVLTIYFSVVMLFVDLESAGEFFRLILLFLFLPLSTMMMTMMGMSSAMVTMSSTNSMVNTTARVMSLNRFSKNKKKAAINPKNLSKNANRGTTAISTLASGSNSKVWGGLKKSTKITGAVVGGAAGLVLGPGGAALGSQLGSSIAGASLQMPRNVVAGVKGIMDTRGKVKSGQLNLDNISDKRQYFGNMGESIGSMVGQGKVGRKIGYGLSKINKERLLTSTELGGLGGVNLADIVSKYPEAKIQFQQTNEGSGFYLDEGGNMKLISPIGEADTLLRQGEVRTIDYKPITSSNIPDTVDRNQLFVQSSAVKLHDPNGNTFVDNHFDTSKWRPEQHCNIGTIPSSIKVLSGESPNSNSQSKGGESNERT